MAAIKEYGMGPDMGIFTVALWTSYLESCFPKALRVASEGTKRE